MSTVLTGYLSDNVKIDVEAPTATGTTTINSSAYDMAGYEGILFLVRLGSPASNNNIRAQQDTVSGMGSAADLAGTLVNSASINLHALDINRPSERYVRCQVTRGTTTTIDTIVVLRYKSRALAIAQGAAIVLEQYNAPAEGTA